MEKNEAVKRPTLGQISANLHEKSLEEGKHHTVSERIDMAASGYWQIVMKKLEEGKKKYNSDFFIEMCERKSKLWNVNPEWLPMARRSCPTPMFEQSVFHYRKADDALDYLWTIPNIDACCWLLHNALLIPEDQKWLLSFVIDYKDGKLFKQMKQLNKEFEPSSSLIIC